ncbi:hypothetical protein [Advenella mimigardefordensis]|uniref:hypothetical protein n=1 Tax=Advenella mimigardefordensis TaxID=302406 RepID=UPI00046D0516|nr:hypothetical protein [Advenella mimigardefordensis]
MPWHHAYGKWIQQRPGASSRICGESDNGIADGDKPDGDKPDSDEPDSDEPDSLYLILSVRLYHPGISTLVILTMAAERVDSRIRLQ